MLARALIVLAFSFPFVVPTRPDGKADFDAALVAVKKQVDGKHWKEAKAMLATALDAHANQPYVRERLDDVRSVLATCAFELAVPRETAKELFCGELASYDAKTGDIELRWDRAKQPKGKFPCADFEATSWGNVLALPFDGPCSIEISGKAIGQKVPVLLGCVDGTRAYEAKLDAGSMSRLLRTEDDASVGVASSTTSFNVARPYVLKLAVRAEQIEASINGGRLVMGAKKKEELGRLGYRDLVDPQKIAVQGKARVAWIEERLEQRRAEARKAFDAKHDVATDLPEWLTKG